MSLSKSRLEKLLEARIVREEYELRVIAALNVRYQRTDRHTTVARESATAGHVYSYLALALGEMNSHFFKRRIKGILLEHDIIQPVESQGYWYFKGLSPLQEDLLRARELMDRHRIEQDRYRIRQRRIANRKIQLLQATKKS